MLENPLSRRRALVVAVALAFTLGACGGSSNSSDSSQSASAITVPAAPAGLGYADSAPVQDETTVLPFVDYAATNVRGDACHATMATNAGVRVLAGFQDLWTPVTLFVDAGVTAPAAGTCPAVVATTWSGLPGVSPDGTKVNATALDQSINYVATVTQSRTAAQELAAYLDDRRGKGYSITDGMGPLTSAWRTAAQQTTTITGIPSDATTVKYDDGGNNTGVGGASNTTFGSVVDFVNSIGANASTEPAKRYYKYARPYRWSSSVVVAPSLVPAESTSPVTDGGFPSGHTAEAVRDSIAMAYAVPERFQEILARGLELGEDRILAGMHSPLDVIGGRILGMANAAGNIANASDPTLKTTAYTQAHTALMAAAGVSTLADFNAYAHSGTTSSDRFADHDTNKANYLRRLTFGMSPVGVTTKAAAVPKGAEAILETRLPYLSAAQRRVVLKSTALPSGYPVMDDAEGWGRLNLFAAADGYGRFDGDVTVSMDASLDGFNAQDSWRNDIAGAGKLTKQGSGALTLTGANTYTGGTQLDAGTLEGTSATAFGKGDVYVDGGILAINASGMLTITGNYTQLGSSTLQLKLGSGSQGRLTVSGTTTLSAGTLHVSFQGGYKPAVGDTLNVITSGKLQGKFTTITVDGFTVTPTYTSTGVTLHIDA